MKCQYCQQDCQQVLEPSKLTRWECEPCGANFRYAEWGGLITITWKGIYVNGHQYFIKSYSGITGNAPEFVVYWQTTNSEGKTYWEEVVRFDFIPDNWTPQNVADKLKAYLPFL